MLVLAGAGTGKTRVLTTRIAHILATGRAFPSQILAVTFTNKAAREMKQRIGVLVGEAVEGMPWLGTFHSIGVKMLRRHAELAGLKSELHHSRHRRPDPPDQADHPGRRAGRQALAGAPVRADDRRLEEQGPWPRRYPRGRRPRLRQRQGPRALQGLSGPADDAERLRFRRPAAATRSASSAQHRDVLAEYHRGSNTSSSTSTRTPTPRSTCGCGCWRSGRRRQRRRPLPLDGEMCRQAG